MENLSDSLRGELDSVTSTDSLQLITDEFHLRHLSTPDVSNIELSKRVALLELENERLRIDLENARIDLNARIAANQGLKGKITELFVEMQSLQQEKKKVQNTLTDTGNRLSAAEASTKWYQSQMHILMATKKTLQVEIDTYQSILKRRQQSVMDMNDNYKRLNADYMELAQQHQREKREMQNAIRELQLCLRSVSANAQKPTAEASPSLTSDRSPTDLSMVLEATEDELRNTRAELKTLEQQLMSNEAAKMSMENALSKQRVLISSMEESMQRCETEKNETADLLRRTQFEMQKLRSENETLRMSLSDSKREQSQVEDVIFHLRIQLGKMIAQYKLLKTKNVENEEKLAVMQDLVNENKRLKTLSHKANSALLKKLREEKSKIKSLEQKLYGKQMNGQLSNLRNKTEHSLREYLKQLLSRNKDLQDQLKSRTKVADENIDEGYGDSSIHTSSSVSLDTPLPSPMNSVLLNSAVDVLSRSKDFCQPMQEELSALRSKIEKLHEQCSGLSQREDLHSGVNEAIPSN